MEDLKKGFKSLWNKASNQVNQATGPGFQGSGQRLGTAEERGERPKLQGQGARSSQQPSSSGGRVTSRPASLPTGPVAHATTPIAAPHATTSTALAAAAREPLPSLAPAAEFDPFAAQLGTGAALSTIRTEESMTAAAPSTSHSGPAPEAVSTEHVEDMQHALALIVSQPQSGSSLEVLHKLLSNLAGRPHEPKFRQVRLSNAKVQQAVVQVAGGLELLQAVGFQTHLGGADGDDGFAAFLDDAALPLVHEGVQQLRRVMAAATNQQPVGRQASTSSSVNELQGSDAHRAVSPEAPGDAAAGASAATTPAPSAATGTSPPLPTPPPPAAAVAPAPRAATPAHTATSAPTTATATSAGLQSAPPPTNSAPLPASAATAAMPAPLQQLPPPPRNLQVLLPVAPDTDVPSWFFERTGAEVKAEYMRLLKVRKESQVFAWRGPSPTPPNTTRRLATLRIRFPEGVALQGDFGASEPLTAVFEFVTAALRDPAATYELALPSRRPLPLAGRVADVPELLPSALLNFRRLGGEGAGGRAQQLPFLQDALLRQAQVT